MRGNVAQLLALRLIHAVDELKDVAKSLRRLPLVEPGLPTVRCLAMGPSPHMVIVLACSCLPQPL